MAINGTDLRIWIDDVIVAHATSHTLSVKMGTRGTSDKDSGVFETKEPGRFEVSGSSDSLMVYDSFETILAALTARQPLKMDFGQKNEADSNLDTSYIYATGNFILTGFDMNAPDNDNAGFTISFEHYSDFEFVAGT